MVDNLRELYRDLLSRHYTMALATADPHGTTSCATVCFVVDKRGDIIFASDRKTTKVKNLAVNEEIAIAIHDGGRSMTGVQVRGTAEEIKEPAAITSARELLIARHPSLAKAFDNPSLALFRVIPRERILVNFSWGVDWRQSVPA